MTSASTPPPVNASSSPPRSFPRGPASHRRRPRCCRCCTCTGLSTSDFGLVLEQFLGSGAGLSASSITSRTRSSTTSRSSTTGNVGILRWTIAPRANTNYSPRRTSSPPETHHPRWKPGSGAGQDVTCSYISPDFSSPPVSRNSGIPRTSFKLASFFRSIEQLRTSTPAKSGCSRTVSRDMRASL